MADGKKNGKAKTEITKMSSRGQVVIPQELRERLGVNEGSIFVVAGSGDTLILRKVNTPSEDILIEELEKIKLNGKKRMKNE